MRFSQIIRLFVLFLISVACEAQYESTYVVPTVLNVRKGPSTNQSVVTQVRRGQELKILERQETWLNVRLVDETEGWVHGDYVGSPADVRASLQKDIKKRQGTRVRRPRRSPTSTPKQTTKSNELTIDGLLENLPGEIPTESLPPIDGVARVMGAAAEGQVVVEFWGDENKLERAMIMVSVLDLSEDEMNRNADYALEFVKSSLPGLNRDRAWMLKRLREISSRDAGTGELQAKGRTVSFEFLKVLGSVRISVVKDA